ncbi:hypothetical protein CC86DRAFT_366823 [Ophiobolus disseminans]|uniref:Extracellular membrane protein CFEM domain-containing protein n=1 Tax=Ophiobolus disseminans TaxID=1469910 RepID=A0A6A7ADX7_9PLEO|nr:hypothetical protein CC86DRAFT_366823 [Ophiobolus disseminans]
MKLSTIIATFTFAMAVSAKDKCCNYTNGGKCIRRCSKEDSPASFATDWVKHLVNALPDSAEAVEVKEDVKQFLL